MVSRYGLKRLTRAIGFLFGALLLSALVGASTAVAQQGNTQFELNALASNTTGSENSAFGVNALGNNTVGSYNTASGRVEIALEN